MGKNLQVYSFEVLSVVASEEASEYYKVGKLLVAMRSRLLLEDMIRFRVYRLLCYAMVNRKHYGNGLCGCESRSP